MNPLGQIPEKIISNGRLIYDWFYEQPFLTVMRFTVEVSQFKTHVQYQNAFSQLEGALASSNEESRQLANAKMLILQTSLEKRSRDGCELGVMLWLSNSKKDASDANEPTNVLGYALSVGLRVYEDVLAYVAEKALNSTYAECFSLPPTTPKSRIADKIWNTIFIEKFTNEFVAPSLSGGQNGIDYIESFRTFALDQSSYPAYIAMINNLQPFGERSTTLLADIQNGTFGKTFAGSIPVANKENNLELVAKLPELFYAVLETYPDFSELSDDGSSV